MSATPHAIEISGLEIKSGAVSLNVPPPGLAVGRGAFCALVGASGSGKSVLLSVLTGHLLCPWMDRDAVFKCGKFSVLGNAVDEDVLSSKRKLNGLFGTLPIVYMPQKLPEDKSNKRSTAAEMTDIAKAIAPNRLRFHLKRRIAEVFAERGLRETLRKPLSSLSGGQRKRVEILARIVGAAEMTTAGDSREIIFLLDEPMTGLDAKNQLEYFNFLKSAQNDRENLSATFVVTTHAFELLDENAGIFDTVLMVRKRGGSGADAENSDVSDCELAFCGTPAEFAARKDLTGEIK